MLGDWLRSKTVRVALWTSTLGVGVYDTVLAHHWGRAPLYVGLWILGAAMCATMHSKFTQSVEVASVASYVKGREHNARTEQTAQIIAMGRRN